MSEQLSRRGFIRSASGAALLGIFGATVKPRMSTMINETVSDVTGLDAGNAHLQIKIEAECAGAPDLEECVENYELDTSGKVSLGVIAPITEEISFRALPSYVHDAFVGDDNYFKNIIGGTEKLHFSRSEFIAGALSSLVFGYAHNVTDDGFDARTIPASQMVGGMMHWYGMRRFGIGASIVAHSANNLSAF